MPEVKNIVNIINHWPLIVSNGNDKQPILNNHKLANLNFINR